MERIFSCFKQSKLLNAVFLSNIFLSFHYYLIIYVNSTFLNTIFSETQVSTLYIIAACINTLLLLNASKILAAIGNYKMAMYAITIQLLAMSGIIVSTNHFLTGFFFILTELCIPAILFSLDIFLESASGDETKTGDIRGIFLTLSNTTLVIAPSVVGVLLLGNVYGYVYGLSVLFLIPLYYVIKKYFSGYVDGPANHIQIRQTIREYLRDQKLYNVFSIYFLLQLFYAFMVVYTPMYLTRYIGFSWAETGVMFTIMLLPFILFELPVGDLADRKYGEKEFLTIGLVIMGLSTMFISFITVKSFFIWTAILFLTRTGASIVEVTSDSYFFKMVNQNKTDVISFYRVARPLSYIVAPIIATLSLQFIPFEYTFIIIGICMIIGTHFSMALVDSR
ncbi:MAG: Glucose/galactose transporter [Patescibacteria group bacterium]|nr:Glucose/galactose transporter [Patescibacteria group bacterium]